MLQIDLETTCKPYLSKHSASSWTKVQPCFWFESVFFPWWTNHLNPNLVMFTPEELITLLELACHASTGSSSQILVQAIVKWHFSCCCHFLILLLLLSCNMVKTVPTTLPPLCLSAVAANLYSCSCVFAGYHCHCGHCGHCGHCCLLLSFYLLFMLTRTVTIYYAYSAVKSDISITVCWLLLLFYKIWCAIAVLVPCIASTDSPFTAVNPCCHYHCINVIFKILPTLLLAPLLLLLLAVASSCLLLFQ